jgi:hypothetical protein
MSVKPKKLSPFAVELSSGKHVVRPPPYPFGDCRACSLIGWICEDLDYPCKAIREMCPFKDKNIDCEECKYLEQCLEKKPCCWECKYLMECLEMARDWGAEEFVKEVYGVEWSEFIDAVKMLRKTKKHHKQQNQ